MRIQLSEHFTYKKLSLCPAIYRHDDFYIGLFYC